MTDDSIVHQNTKGEWCFWDEFYVDEIGSYLSKEEAEKAYKQYDTELIESNNSKSCLPYPTKFVCHLCGVPWTRQSNPNTCPSCKQGSFGMVVAAPVEINLGVMKGE